MRTDPSSGSAYYPFGMMMPHPQNTQPGGHKFGFNGMESNDELKGNQNSYTTQFRQYDPRLGRWSSIDPKAAKYPSQSPYHFSFNNPIAFNDPRGDDAGENEGETHTVKDYDKSKKDGTLSGIASQYGHVSTEELANYNNIDIKKDGSAHIEPGDELKIPPKENNAGTAGDGKGGGQKKEKNQMDISPIQAETDRNKDVVRRKRSEGPKGSSDQPPEYKENEVDQGVDMLWWEKEKGGEQDVGGGEPVLETDIEVDLGDIKQGAIYQMWSSDAREYFPVEADSQAERGSRTMTWPELTNDDTVKGTVDSYSDLKKWKGQKSK